MKGSIRSLLQIIESQPSEDGAGVKIQRLAGRSLHNVLNPFLMIDEINSDEAADYLGGFPEHPHRGFETITYMKSGRMRHRDHLGNEGVIGPGDVQWMTAGAGVLHSEMPEQEQGLLHGFQIWLNLPAAEKMKPAAYREFSAQEIKQYSMSEGGQLRVIAGEVTVDQQTLEGHLMGASTEPLLLDVKLTPNETVSLSFNSQFTARVYVYGGATDQLSKSQLGIYQKGESLQLKATDFGAELLVLSGRPIEEPLVQYGPFVMNSIEEIEQAISDFQDIGFLRSLSAN